MARLDFRALAARRLAQERELPTTYIDPFVGPHPAGTQVLRLVVGERRDSTARPPVPAGVRRRPTTKGIPMISKRVRKLLVSQVKSELTARHAYLGIALYFERQSLDGWAAFFRRQSEEEGGHAAKIIAFLLDNEVEFDLPPVDGAATRFGSAREAVEAALRSEVRVTGQFDAIARAATRKRDHRSLQFLQWFIGEQVEEERTMRRLLDLIGSGMSPFQSEALLESAAKGAD